MWRTFPVIYIDIICVCRERKVLNLMKKIKKYDELSFIDDFLFGKIMKDNLELCKELLELILDIEINEVELDDCIIDDDPPYCVKLFAYANESEITSYNVLLQPEKQMSYDIFICPHDVHGRNLPIYTLKCVFDKEHSLIYGDELIFVNAEGSRDDLSGGVCRFLDYKTGRVGENCFNVSSDMRKFLDYLVEKKATNDFTQKLQDAVDSAIAKKEWRNEYQTSGIKHLKKRKKSIIEANIVVTIKAR